MTRKSKLNKIWQIIIDTNVLVAALKSKRGASFRILSLLKSGKYRIHISVPIVLEYEEVLSRRELDLNLTDKELAKLLDIICLLGEKHDIWYLWRPLLSDPKDEFIAKLAINAQVDAIVTYNVKDFVGIKNFGINIITPKEFLILLGEEL